MPRVVGIDHLVLSVGDLKHSREFYDKVLGFLCFKLKHDGGGFAGWSNGKTLFWIAQADAPGRKHKYRKDLGKSKRIRSMSQHQRLGGINGHRAMRKHP